MKRKLMCTVCHKKFYIISESTTLTLSPQDILCWDHDPELQKNLNKELALNVKEMQAKLPS